ncbi:hypothetical protein ACOSQ3_016500 [Xanthoceras sorbifolium]
MRAGNRSRSKPVKAAGSDSRRSSEDGNTDSVGAVPITGLVRSPDSVGLVNPVTEEERRDNNSVDSNVDTSRASKILVAQMGAKGAKVINKCMGIVPSQVHVSPNLPMHGLINSPMQAIHETHMQELRTIVLQNMGKAGDKGKAVIEGLALKAHMW